MEQLESAGGYFEKLDLSLLNLIHLRLLIVLRTLSLSIFRLVQFLVCQNFSDRVSTGFVSKF